MWFIPASPLRHFAARWVHSMVKPSDPAIHWSCCSSYWKHPLPRGRYSKMGLQTIGPADCLHWSAELFLSLPPLMMLFILPLKYTRIMTTGTTFQNSAQDSFPSRKELTIFKNHSSSLQVSLQALHRFGSLYSIYLCHLLFLLVLSP